jgi:hypothetical protein
VPGTFSAHTLEVRTIEAKGKGVHPVLNFISTFGPANTTVNFTDDLSILLSGLIGLAWLSATMIVISALRESFSRPVKPELLEVNDGPEHRLAA